MEPRPVSLAVLGVGRMGSFHVRSLQTSPSINIVAMADPSSDALASVGDLVPEAARYQSIDEALAHPELDCCLVATPTPTHPEMTRAALTAGLHVLCEKPISLDPDDGPELEQLASSVDRILQVGFWRRFSPPWMEARRLIAEGRIGRPLMVRLSQWDADPPPPGFCDPTVSGGLAVDCGVHEFDLARWLTGRTIQRVRAWAPPPVDRGIADVGDLDNLVAVLELDGGAVATVDLSRNARYGDDVRTEILGSDGAIFVDLLPTGRTRLATADGIEVVASSEAADATSAGVIGQAESFAARVRGVGNAGPSAIDSSRATAVGLAVRKAAESGTAVEP